MASWHMRYRLLILFFSFGIFLYFNYLDIILTLGEKKDKNNVYPLGEEKEKEERFKKIAQSMTKRYYELTTTLEEKHLKNAVISEDLSLVRSLGSFIEDFVGLLKSESSKCCISKEHMASVPSLLQLEKIIFPWTINFLSKYQSIFNTPCDCEGKGIIISSNKKYFSLTANLLENLKILKVDVPVVIAYYENELTNTDRNSLSRIFNGTEFVDLSLNFPFVLYNLFNNLGFVGKPLALLSSRFCEVMLIDADTLFLQNPSILFDDPQYKAHGALYFHDRNGATGLPNQASFIKALLNNRLERGPASAIDRYLKGETHHLQESGVVVVNRQTNFYGLLASTMLNIPPFKYVTELNTWGDKELFWIGSELTGDSYQFSIHHVGGIGDIKSRNNKETVCGLMTHFSNDGALLWWNGGFRRYKLHNPIDIINFTVWGTSHSWDMSDFNCYCMFDPTIYQLSMKEKDLITQLEKHWLSIHDKTGKEIIQF